MKTKISAWWDSLPAKKRKIVVMSAVGAVMLVVTYIGWSQARKKPIAAAVQEGSKEIKLGGGLLDKSQLLDSQAQIAKLQQQIIDSRKAKDNPQPIGGEATAVAGQIIPAVNGQIPSVPAVSQQKAVPPGTDSAGIAQLPPPTATAAHAKAGKGKIAAGNQASIPAPPLPPLPPGSPPTSASTGIPGSGMSGAARNGSMTELGEYGDIAIVSANTSGNAKVQKDEDKKKGVKSVYLPGGSFMEATLLSGLDAPTTESAKGHPVPVLLRVKAPAQLPSDVRANIRGCFVVADGKGNLATERAELTLVSMACMDRKGNAVIDQDVKGWIVDDDGRVGLRGVVVAKMGSMIARSMLAGFLGGMGEAFKASVQTTNISALGVNTVNTTGEKAVYAGIGQGLSSAFTETQKFYMELARQTLPVISVGATKVVTLVIGKGVSLEIKKSIN